MNAQDTKLIDLLDGKKQFVVPVFQRDYSWGTKQCLQLWNDVVRAGTSDSVTAHFVGSVVYIAAEQTSANIARWLLIDGQQRLTTLTLLLIAMRDKILSKQANEDSENASEAVSEDALSPDDIAESYLINRHGTQDRKYKLQLRRVDHETLSKLVDGTSSETTGAERIIENFKFFSEQLAGADLGVIYNGINKLRAVDVHLHRGQDDPQMIFESLNSTGLDLTQADLIRNFVLMSQEEKLQTELYTTYWQPMETYFGSRYRTDFDNFVRDYLTLELKPSRPIRSDEVYHRFRSYFNEELGNVNVQDILAKLQRFARYYVAYAFGSEPDSQLKERLGRLRSVIEVASPVVMRLYDCKDRVGSLQHSEFVEAVDLLESYVFRRSICSMQTRSLGQIFASLAHRIKEGSPLLSLKTSLYLQSKKRRFPTDKEFSDALETRDVYDMRHCFYLLDRLENNSKEKIDTKGFSIEHVMPQNENLNDEWQEMLGQDWSQIQQTWLHRLGNMTLTGYNSTYSDKSFEEKKTIPDGFNYSPLRLNKFIKEQSMWTAGEIEARGKQLAQSAAQIWTSLVVGESDIKAARLEEMKASASRYSLDSLELTDANHELFSALRSRILGIGDDLTELFTAKTVVYRVFDYFLEVIPRKNRLALLLNLEFEACEGPPPGTKDVSDFAFITHATETGGVMFSFDDLSQLDDAIGLIRQAYEGVSE